MYQNINIKSAHFHDGHFSSIFIENNEYYTLNECIDESCNDVEIKNVKGEVVYEDDTINGEYNEKTRKLLENLKHNIMEEGLKKELRAEARQLDYSESLAEAIMSGAITHSQDTNELIECVTRILGINHDEIVTDTDYYTVFLKDIDLSEILQLKAVGFSDIIITTIDSYRFNVKSSSMIQVDLIW